MDTLGDRVPLKFWSPFFIIWHVQVIYYINPDTWVGNTYEMVSLPFASHLVSQVPRGFQILY